MSTSADDNVGLFEEFKKLKERNAEVEKELSNCRNVMTAHQKQIHNLEESKIKMKMDVDGRIKEVQERLEYMAKEALRMKMAGSQKQESESGPGLGRKSQPPSYSSLFNQQDMVSLHPPGAYAGASASYNGVDDEEEEEEEEEEKEIDGKNNSTIAHVDVTTAEMNVCSSWGFFNRKKPPSRKKVQKQSFFIVHGNTPIQLPRNIMTKLHHYDRDNDMSPYMNCKTGEYTVPMIGKYFFAVWDDTSSCGLWDWFICSNGGGEDGEGGRKEKVKSSWCYGGWNKDGHKLSTGIRYERVEWDCQEGEVVWVEGVGWRDEASRVGKFKFFGKMIECYLPKE